METRGAEHVPRTGPVLLASNHLSIMDSAFLPLSMEREITFMAKQEYFKSDSWRQRLTTSFMQGSGQIPVDRGNQRTAVASLHSCLDVLERGDVLCIYPEGTRSPDGRLYRARTGVARLALKCAAPVVPVAMFGTERVLPPGSRIPRPAGVRIVFGPPVDLSATAGDADGARAGGRPPTP